MRLMSRGAGVVQTSSRGIKRRSMSHNPEGMRTTSQGPAKSELHPGGRRLVKSKLRPGDGLNGRNGRNSSPENGY